MARQARVAAVGIPHHVTQRGNDRQDIFLLDDDRRRYLALLGEYGERYGLSILGYCLMTNHVHLVVVPERDDALSQALGNTHQRHAQRFNQRYRRSGHVWQNRFYSCALGPDRAAVALAYGDLNPVRAGLAPRAEEWEWSSARAHASGRDESGLLDLDACRRWVDLDDWGTILASGGFTAEANELRRATASGLPYGDDGFVDQLELATGRSLRPKLPGPQPRQTRSASA